MKRLLVIALSVFCWSVLSAQQLPIFSLYHDNNFVLNPAIAGSEDHGILAASYRDQWSKMEGKPKTINGSYRTPIFRTNMGIGGHVVNDQVGPTALTGASVAYAYHISFRKINPFHWARFLRKSKISLGISVSMYQYRLKSSELVLETPNDQAIADSDDSKFLPNGGVGIYYYYDNFYLGFSAPQLIPLNVKFEGENSSAGVSTVKRVNHYYTVVGGRIPLGGKVPRGYLHKLYIEPMVWFKYVKGAPYQYDAYLRIKHKDIVWAGVGYRSSKTLVFDAGFMIRSQLQVGYAYDLSISDLRPYLGNTHEIMLSYHFQSKQSRSYGVR